jgi:hypothetical protein
MTRKRYGNITLIYQKIIVLLKKGNKKQDIEKNTKCDILERYSSGPPLKGTKARVFTPKWSANDTHHFCICIPPKFKINIQNLKSLFNNKIATEIL